MAQWVEFVPNSDGSVPAFLLAKMDSTNKPYQAALYRALQDVESTEDMSLSASEEAMQYVFFEAILLDWRNFQITDDGKNIPFSKQAAIEIIGSQEWSGLYDELVSLSRKLTDSSGRDKAQAAQNLADVLLYSIEMGPIENNLIQQAKRNNKPIPDRVLNKPVLLPGLALFMDAFFDLEHERQWLGGHVPVPMAIPWTSIHSYAVAHGLEGEVFHDLVHFLRVMDSAYISYMTSKSAPKGKNTKR